jgi:hypothetical protein
MTLRYPYAMLVLQEGDEIIPKHGIVVDLTRRHAQHCVWALTGTLGQIIQPAVPLLPLTRYYVRLVYQLTAPSGYSLAGDVDGKIVTDWSEPVVTFSKEYVCYRFSQ